MALLEASKEGIWLKGPINNLGFPYVKAIMFCDSLSIICLGDDQVHHEKTKHIDVRYHFIHTKKMIKVQKSPYKGKSS